MSKQPIEKIENNDLEEQYLLLEEEEKKENKRKISILIIIFILILIISIIGATFSYERYKHHHHHKPTETCTINCDTDNNNKPDLNIDYEGDGYPHFNVDTDGDIKADFNLMNQDIDNDGTCDLNCDNNKDGWPDFNIDLDGDGVADLNIKDNDNKLINMDIDGDGKCDNKCNGVMEEAEVDNNNNVVLTIDYMDESLYYIGVTKSYYAYDIRPGWKDVIEFKVVNNSPKNAYYRVRWVDIINTITEVNNITYRISKDNKLVINETKAPYESAEILNKVLITPNTTYTYKIEFEFKETGIDQSMDQNKEFSGTIRIDALS